MNRRATSDYRIWIICLILAMGTFALFAPVLGHDFINYDDDVYVSKNPHIQQGLTTYGVTWAFTTDYACNWHPLTWISHMLDCEFYGLKPAGHHLTSLLFHTINALLLFALIRGITGAVWRSALVAALFAWHPLHVESVAWVAERKDVLSTFFWLLTLLAYWRYAQESKVEGRRSKLFYGLTLFSFALGLISKPMLVTLPFVLLLLDYWPLGRTENTGMPGVKSGGKARQHPGGIPWRRLVIEKWPFFALALASSLVTFFAQKSGGAVVDMEKLPLELRAANAVLAYGSYLRKLVWPSDLAVFYPHFSSWSAWHLAGVMLLLGVVTVVAIVRRKTHPWLLVGWFWFLGTLVPVIGLVQVGSQALADRYTYVPLVGVFIVGAWAAGEFFERRRSPRAAWTMAAVTLAACAVVTHAQVGHWKNGEELFRHAIAVTSNNVVAYENLSRALDSAGKPREAKTNLLKALEANPQSPSLLNAMGIHLATHGDVEGAVHYFKLTLQLQPRLGQTHNNLANALTSQGRFVDAAREYAEALKSGYDNADFRKSFASILLQLDRPAEAAEQLAAALRHNPNYPEAHYLLGEVFARQGRATEAIKSYREAIRLKPDWPVALGTLAWMLATNPRPEIRNGPEAVRLAERACNLLEEPDLRFLSTLDAAYAESGRFEDAIKAATKVIQLANAPEHKGFADQATARLELYRAGKPFRQ